MEHHPVAQSDTQPDDIVWGATRIGKVINRNPRQTFYLLENSKLPGRKIGGRWCASRRALLAAVVGE